MKGFLRYQSKTSCSVPPCSLGYTNSQILLLTSIREGQGRSQAPAASGCLTSSARKLLLRYIYIQTRGISQNCANLIEPMGTMFDMYQILCSNHDFFNI